MCICCGTVLVHLCGKIGMILYVYIFCGTGSCPPLWEDWHDIICVYVVAPVLVHLCGKIGMILYVYIMWHRFLSTSVAPVIVQLCEKIGIFCGTSSCLSTAVGRLHYHIISLRWGVWPLTNKFKHASRY